MRKLIAGVIIICSTAILITSCSKDEGDNATGPDPKFVSLVQSTGDCLHFYSEFFEGFLYILQHVDYRIGIEQFPIGVRCWRTAGRYEIDINRTGDIMDKNSVSGWIIAADSAMLYDWEYIFDSYGIVIDSILVPTDTLPPSYIGDGLHQDETVITPWKAVRDPLDPHIVGLGTFSIRMLTHDRYWFTISQKTKFYADDSCSLEITSLGFSWDLAILISDTSFAWPSGLMEFTASKGSDTLIGVFDFSNLTSPTATITGTYNGIAKNMTIDLKTFEITF